MESNKKGSMYPVTGVNGEIELAIQSGGNLDKIKNILSDCDFNEVKEGQSGGYYIKNDTAYLTRSEGKGSNGFYCSENGELAISFKNKKKRDKFIEFFNLDKKNIKIYSDQNAAIYFNRPVKKKEATGYEYDVECYSYDYGKIRIERMNYYHDYERIQKFIVNDHILIDKAKGISNKIPVSFYIDYEKNPLSINDYKKNKVYKLSGAELTVENLYKLLKKIGQIPLESVKYKDKEIEYDIFSREVKRLNINKKEYVGNCNMNNIFYDSKSKNLAIIDKEGVGLVIDMDDMTTETLENIIKNYMNQKNEQEEQKLNNNSFVQKQKANQEVGKVTMYYSESYGSKKPQLAIKPLDEYLNEITNQLEKWGFNKVKEGEPGGYHIHNGVVYLTHSERIGSYGVYCAGGEEFTLCLDPKIRDEFIDFFGLSKENIQIYPNQSNKLFFKTDKLPPKVDKTRKMFIETTIGRKHNKNACCTIF